MYCILDIVLTVMHVGVILFNSLGWIWERTRRWHLILMSMTFVSWFILGIWYDWGYCFLTDWHWKVKGHLGETALPASFIKYAADQMTGRDWNSGLIDTITLVVFLFSILMTLYVNLFPWMKKYKS